MPADQPTPPSVGSAPKKPPGLSAVLGLSIAVAILAMLGCLGGLAGLAGVKHVPTPWKATGAQPTSEQMRRLAEVQTRMLEASRFTPAIPLYVAAFPVATWLLVSVWRVSRRQRGALVGFGRAALLFALLELLLLGLQIMIGVRVRPLMAEMVAIMSPANGGPLPEGVS